MSDERLEMTDSTARTHSSLSAHASSLAPLVRLYDPLVIFIAGALMALGVAMVYSASVTVDGPAFNWHEWWNSPLKQCVFAFIGFLVMLVAAHVDYHALAWRRPGDGWAAWALFVVTLLLLIGVFVPGIGHESLGARRSIMLFRGPPTVQFQPSELAKVVIVIWLAAWLTRGGSRLRPGDSSLGIDRQLGMDDCASVDSARARGPSRQSTINRQSSISSFRRGFLPAVLIAGALVGLTGIEDYGTAALMGIAMLVLLYVARVRWTHLGLLVLCAALAGAALVVIKPHRIGRIKTFFDQAPDPMGAGYQINQALLAIGSGGWTGRGLGAGVQKYGYLPQDNNDFILAIICEELGIVGGIVVVALFLALLLRGWWIARHAPDAFGRLLAIGLTLTICLQAAMNVGVVTHSIPTKGISLPFVSAGGSGVVFLGLAAGLLAAVGRSYAPRSGP
jgi:cell division protein FtsW